MAFAQGGRGGGPAVQLIREGKIDDAVKMVQEQVKASPDSSAALQSAGMVMDLAGRYPEAHTFFQKTVELAPNPQAKAQALRNLANSYGFEGDCKNTSKYLLMVVDYWKTRESEEPHNAFYQEGEMANEAARYCIDAGDLNEAERLYKLGHDLGVKEPDSPARKALWEFRTEHALARLAARRGNKAEAEKHVAAAKTALDHIKAADANLGDQQQSFLPYLTGYVALYTGDYKTALDDLQKANQNDAFIQCLIGLTYEKMGQKDKATEYYRKASAATSHNPPGGFVRRFTREKLGAAAQGTMPPAVGKPIDLATIRYIDIAEGSGAPARPGAQYTVHYTGWLRDGTQFDSSAGRDPLKFVQGRREVIPGFDIGFEGMKVGGKRRIMIPFQLAYGEQARGQIPPRSDLTFDVELLEVTDAAALTAGADLLLPLDRTEKEVLALAKAVPEEKYSWTPGPGVRTFRAVFLHIAYGNRLMLRFARGEDWKKLGPDIEKQLKDEQASLTKDQVIQALTDSFAEVRATFQNARAASLGRSMDFFGRPTTQRGILIALDVHIGEHLGQAIAYARMNGIVPPWSK